MWHRFGKLVGVHAPSPARKSLPSRRDGPDPTSTDSCPSPRPPSLNAQGSLVGILVEPIKFEYQENAGRYDGSPMPAHLEQHTSCGFCLQESGVLGAMDPSVAAAYHNLNHSLLCRLSEELLLDIMEYLDPVSIYRLRKVSRLFPRLFGSACFAHLHDDQSFSDPRPWTSQRPLEATQRYWEPMAELIRKDRYCAQCWTEFPNPTWEEKFERLRDTLRGVKDTDIRGDYNGKARDKEGRQLSFYAVR